MLIPRQPPVALQHTIKTPHLECITRYLPAPDLSPPCPLTYPGVAVAVFHRPDYTADVRADGDDGLPFESPVLAAGEARVALVLREAVAALADTVGGVRVVVFGLEVISGGQSWDGEGDECGEDLCDLHLSRCCRYSDMIICSSIRFGVEVVDRVATPGDGYDAIA